MEESMVEMIGLSFFDVEYFSMLDIAKVNENTD
jgi:hypothetical protein